MPDPMRKPGDAKEQSPGSGEQPSSTGQAASAGDKPADAPKPPETVTLTVDGRSITVPKGTLVVEAAKQAGIEVPVFCYHHKLDPVGACRLCLVEIQPGPPKPQTACTTPAAEGMTVRTQSALAVGGRADILEFELVNHPLDCPVCDKGGECPLQDYTYRHGYPVSRIDQPRLHFKKPIPLSANIALDRERCVLCYRCTRYYDEIAWEQELTTDNRGVESFITSQFDRPLQSVFSGNIIDLCPVGALTSRVWRFESRPWDMNHSASVCSKCSVGCNVTLWQRRNQLVRVTSHENDEIDDGWICDRGRFDYAHVNDPGRIDVPEVRGRRASWDEAMEALVDGLGRHPGPKLGISLPQDVTNEELFLLSRLLAGPWRGARVVMENRTALPATEGKGLMIRDFDTTKVLVVIASDTREDVPIVNLRLKKAARRGTRLLVVHPGELDLKRGPNTLRNTEHVRYEPGGAAAAVRGLAGHELLGAGPIGILYGDGRGTEDAGALVEAVQGLAGATGAAVMPLYRGTNERGALAAAILDERNSLDGVEALFCWGPPAVPMPSSLEFLAVWDTLRRPAHGRTVTSRVGGVGPPDEEMQGAARADVMLPDVSFAETQGSYTNVEGRVQFLHPVLAVEPPRREGWDVLSELSSRLGLETEFLGIFQVQRAAAEAIPAFRDLAEPPAAAAAQRPTMLGPARP